MDPPPKKANGLEPIIKNYLKKLSKTIKNIFFKKNVGFIGKTIKMKPSEALGGGERADMGGGERAFKSGGVGVEREGQRVLREGGGWC